MAYKKVFISTEKGEKDYFREELIEYTFHPGFALSQKQKSIESLHQSIKLKHPNMQVLEVSTKSANGVGVKLSAFNLMFMHEELGEERNLENVFQSSKVFTEGGPYRDLLDVHPREAKRDERLQNSGALIGFELYGELWPTEPKSMFYDWIYVNALAGNPYLSKRIMDYDVFTDIEFNHKRSVNCQSRAAAIFVSLVRRGELEEKTLNMDTFRTIYDECNATDNTQLRWF